MLNADRRKWPGWKVLFGLFVLGALLALGMLIATDAQDNITLLATALRTDTSGTRVVTGTLRNNTDRAYALVEVEVDLLKQDGTVLERTAASTTDLSGGETWSFAVPIGRDDAARFRVVSIACRDTAQSDNQCALARQVEVQ